MMIQKIKEEKKDGYPRMLRKEIFKKQMKSEEDKR